MRHHLVVGLVTLTLVLGGYACSHSPTAPSQAVVTATPVTTVTPTFQGLTIAGNTTFTAIGQTSQLTATARYSNGTTKDVTTAVTQWISTSSSVATVSPVGLVTVVGFGACSIEAVFQGSQSGLQVTATPPNTFVFYGRVREPGNSGIPAVQVRETQSGQSTLTDSEGDYSFGGLTTAHLTFEKDGFEAVGQLEALPNRFNDTALQRIIRVVAGGSLAGLKIAPHDMSYAVGADRCYPCKMIRVTMPTAGTLHVNLTWTEPRATDLNLWVNGGRFVGTGTSSNITRDVPVTAGEVLVYVGFYNLPPAQDGVPFYVPFSVATSTGDTQ